ncbi:CPBP family intramembrane glutamic endopeptidase [Winogradskyella aquimaris]|uniref:CPBP family intramembrane glutamic endopeptidase n=1 Tax=Winogradskyella aquimaris TaxID=864074 RepID=A0ABU5ETE4_9FLAO|nr:CPBP family intramembrane glutamic endopeptidase [Winogradskyella aquimaris]MDY2588181.1 CPBP family intramembrane glutamic endopeptidase [Winogradskyella aquimaris]
MIGILVALALSWLLLHLIERKTILALGFLPIHKRLKQFLIGFLITGILCLLVQYLESYLKSSTWILNKSITRGIILKSFWWDLKSVLTEELIFRGALLYILIQKIGSRKSILISAVAFGIYHWFSYGVLGNVMAMILVFIGTGLMGYAWAWAFSKTRSIMLPFGLHLGWNFVYNTIFSKGPLGDLLLVSKGGNALSDWVGLFNFMTGLIIVPLFVLLFVKYAVRVEHTSKKL